MKNNLTNYIRYIKRNIFLYGLPDAAAMTLI